ncbi:hypothetical protein GHO40_03790 [Pseudomonas helleri]|uniref:Uncharacterized protein n=1 Tax=Pseudomonas helleri TaxID=1608996 RepID=A0A7X2BH14_9PSED|nr:hypothetical protein [Pseudomonas helleri]MQT45858.1 hypothetical protein [Pseudomonas helleri]
MNVVQTAGKSFGDGKLSIHVGTDHPRRNPGGGKAVIDLHNALDIFLKVGVNENTTEPVDSLRIEVHGDNECDRLIEALEYAVEILKIQKTLNSQIPGEEKLY